MKNELNFINPSELSFRLSSGNLMELSYKGEDMGRVALLRMFPFMYEDEYISIRCENYSRADKEQEIGIIRSLNELSEEQAQLVRGELKKRYFVPDILSVNEVKDELGHISWNVVTSAGDREFTVTDMSSNIRSVDSKRVMLTDIYGNRYYIPDVTLLDDKTLKIIEIWI